MDPKIGKALAALAVPIILIVFAAGCIVQQPAANSQSGTPTVILITQIVTQIVPPTPITPSPTSPPTDTPEPTPTATFDPINAPIYYPLADCIASRLHIGDKAMVSQNGNPQGIRYSRDMADKAVDTMVQPGATLQIVNGPWCSRGWLVWQVQTADGIIGYTPEGDGNEYWLFPIAK